MYSLAATKLVWGAVAAVLPLVLGEASQSPLTPQPLKDIPLLGFGTWNLKSYNNSDAVSYAIEKGYRHIDAAKIYGNQFDIGKGIWHGLSATNLRRTDLWVTSKLWNNKHGKNNVEGALKETLNELNLEYLDLYLMHWPVSSVSGTEEIEFVETWKAMVKLVETGLARHVGVSNFSPKQLSTIIAATPHHKPFAHQFELHPYLQQSSFVRWHRENGIHVTAYSPLGNTNPTYTSSRKGHVAEEVPPLLENELLKRIAEERKCTTAQVALKWGMLRGTSVIPKSEHALYIKENREAEDCALQPQDMKFLSKGLPTKRLNNPSRSWGVCLYEALDDSSPCSSINAVKQLQNLKQHAEGFVKSLSKLLFSGFGA